jgi:small subunit ribosomal protein S1
MSEVSAANELNRKDKVTGKVVKATLAGAVVDIGSGRMGVIPISQLSKEPVRKVEDVLKEGDQVEAWVRRADPGHIELTLIQPLAAEWRDLKKDAVVNGKVTKIEKFGAFVEIGAERPGLLHVSEMSHDYVRRPEDVVAVGQDIEVKILEVNRRKKQIKLSIKALAPEPVVEPEPEEEPQKPPRTAMEIALRRAMGEDDDDYVATDERPRTNRRKPENIDDLLAKTLNNRPK